MDPVHSVCMTAAVAGFVVVAAFAFIDLSRAYKDSAGFVYMYACTLVRLFVCFYCHLSDNWNGKLVRVKFMVLPLEISYLRRKGVRSSMSLHMYICTYVQT